MWYISNITETFLNKLITKKFDDLFSYKNAIHKLDHNQNHAVWTRNYFKSFTSLFTTQVILVLHDY